MKFYILDDDITIIKVLKNIIEERDLGEVIGYTTNSQESIQEILLKKPDIVLIDLLMPDKDGIDIVNEIKSSNLDISFIMISQVSSKHMIGEAYNSEIEFFISKPINIIEVTKVIKKVSEKIYVNRTLLKIKDMFQFAEKNTHIQKNDTRIQKIKTILNKLGVLGENGGRDILKICEYVINKEEKTFNYTINEICELLDENARSMQQRIRRTISRALTNIASIGIEDYMNEIFVEYSNSLFNFEEVKAEMDYIRGKKTSGGKINIKKFITGLLTQSEL